jgi:hypothetical protein
MVANLPIVSTKIADVVELYGEAVSVASNAEEFVRACERALNETPGERASKARIMRDIVSSNSWEATAEHMHRLIADTGIKRPEIEASSTMGKQPTSELTSRGE